MTANPLYPAVTARRDAPRPYPWTRVIRAVSGGSSSDSSPRAAAISADSSKSRTRSRGKKLHDARRGPCGRSIGRGYRAEVVLRQVELAGEVEPRQNRERPASEISCHHGQALALDLTA